MGHLERLAGKVEAPSLPKEESHNNRAVPFPNPRLAHLKTSLLALLSGSEAQPSRLLGILIQVREVHTASGNLHEAGALAAGSKAEVGWG